MNVPISKSVPIDNSNTASDHYPSTTTHYQNPDAEISSNEAAGSVWISGIFPGDTTNVPASYDYPTNLGFFLNTKTGVFLAHSIIRTGDDKGDLQYLGDVYWRSITGFQDGVTVRVTVTVPSSVLQSVGYALTSASATNYFDIQFEFPDEISTSTANLSSYKIDEVGSHESGYNAATADSDYGLFVLKDDATVPYSDTEWDPVADGRLPGLSSNTQRGFIPKLQQTSPTNYFLDGDNSWTLKSLSNFGLDLSAVQSTNDSVISLTGGNASTADVSLIAGTNITISTTSNEISISSAGDGTTSLPVKDTADPVATQFTATDTSGIAFAAGGDATIAFDTTNNIVTFSATDTNTEYYLATTTADGLMLKYPAQHGNKFMRADNSWQMVPLEKTVSASNDLAEISYYTDDTALKTFKIQGGTNVTVTEDNDIITIGASLDLSGYSPTTHGHALTGTEITGILTAAKGGTGYGTGNLYTAGDMLYAGTTNTLSIIGLGDLDQVLTLVEVLGTTIPVWQDAGDVFVGGSSPVKGAVTGPTTAEITAGKFLKANASGGTWDVPTDTNFYLTNITKAANTLSFVMEGPGNVTYDFGYNAIAIYNFLENEQGQQILNPQPSRQKPLQFLDGSFISFLEPFEPARNIC